MAEQQQQLQGAACLPACRARWGCIRLFLLLRPRVHRRAGRQGPSQCVSCGGAGRGVVQPKLSVIAEPKQRRVGAAAVALAGRN